MIWLQFFAAAILIIIAGTKLTKSADILGSALGLGAGWAGVLLLPLATSLPEAVTSFRAVIIHSPDLAAGNLLGSNLFNISIIALIDLIQGKGSIFLRIKNGHVLTASLSIMLMSITAIGILLPLPSLWNGWIGLDTVLLIGGYLVAVRLLTVHEKRNMSPEEISCPASTSTIKALLTFVAAALVILFAGVTLTDAANVISFTTGLGQTFVGSMMLAVSTSLPK